MANEMIKTNNMSFLEGISVSKMGDILKPVNLEAFVYRGHPAGRCGKACGNTPQAFCVTALA